MNTSSIRPSSYRPGATIIELLVAVFLVGIIGSALVLGLLYGQKNSLRTHDLMIAQSIARSEIEAIRNLSFANVAAPYSGDFLGSVTGLDALVDGETELSVAYYDPPTNSLKEVTATVRWSERGRAESVSYTTLIANEGLTP